MSVTTTKPSSITIAVTDKYWQGIDETTLIPPGGSITDPVVTLTDQAPGHKAITLRATPILTGNKVLVLLTGSDLTAGHNYTLKVVFNGGEDAPALTSTTTVRAVTPD